MGDQLLSPDAKIKYTSCSNKGLRKSRGSSEREAPTLRNRGKNSSALFKEEKNPFNIIDSAGFSFALETTDTSFVPVTFRFL